MTSTSPALILVAAAIALAAPAAAQAQPARVKPAAGDDLRAVYATPADIAEGKRVADSSCARCHGAAGVSTAKGTPHLAGQRAAYVYARLRDYQQRGRAGSPMEGAVKFLSDQALVKVAAYYASLEPARPAPGPRGPATDADPLQGARAAAASCNGCHGENGVSAIPGTPSLAGLDPKSFAAAMSAYRGGQRQSDVMKSFAASLGDAALGNLALHYALLKPARASTPAAGGDAAAGKIAAASCSGCHGESGVSPAPGTPMLAGQDTQYLVVAMKAYKDGSRKDDTMKAVVGALDDAAMKNIAAYYAAQTPRPPAAVRRPLTVAEWAERCDRCHGVNGNSADPRVPAIAAQRVDWLEQVLEAYRSGARKSSAMSAMSSSLSETDVKALAAYYGRQAPRSVVYVLVPGKNQ